jgi:integrase
MVTYDPQGTEPRQFDLAFRPLLALHPLEPAADFDALKLESLQLSMATGAWMPADEVAKYKARGTVIGWNRGVVMRRVRRIMQAWAWLEKHKLLPAGSAAQLKTASKLPRKAPGVRLPVKRRGSTRTELDAVLPHVQRGRRHRPCAAMLEAQWLCGCRSAEIRLMRPCDIDREAGPVIDGVKVWLYRPQKHKTEHLGNSRVIALGPAAQAILAPWLDACPSTTHYVFRPQCWRKKCRPLYTERQYCRSINRASKRAGVPLCAYSGRHATADRVKRAYGLDGARAVLGQSSLQTTNSYGEAIDLQKAAEIAAKLG